MWSIQAFYQKDIHLLLTPHVQLLAMLPLFITYLFNIFVYLNFGKFITFFLIFNHLRLYEFVFLAENVRFSISFRQAV